MERTKEADLTEAQRVARMTKKITDLLAPMGVPTQRRVLAAVNLLTGALEFNAEGRLAIPATTSPEARPE